MCIDEFELELNKLEIEISKLADCIIDCLMTGNIENEIIYEQMYYDTLNKKETLVDNFNSHFKKYKKSLTRF